MTQDSQIKTEETQDSQTAEVQAQEANTENTPSQEEQTEETQTANVASEQEATISETNEEDKLREILATKEKENVQLKDALLRQQAELANFKRRQADSTREQLKYASQNLISELLPMHDNLERALAHLHEQEDVSEAAKQFITGIEMVKKEFIQVLEKESVQEISPKGEEFNPNQHEAISVSDNKEFENNTVVDVIQKGYSYHDRILRPALVSVAKH